jgi:transposase
VALRNAPGPVGPGAFPPGVVVAVKSIACELPRRTGQPVSRLYAPDIRAELIDRGIVANISTETIWRWLEEDALKPWRHRMWIFPRDPCFMHRASPPLDLYERKFEGRPLEANEFVLSSDEKTSIQARIRRHPTVAGTGWHLRLVEHEYERGGAFAYLAAWDVHRAKLFGRLEATTGIAPFGRLVDQVMASEPYRSARRVFWIVDNGSSHRGAASAARLETAYRNLKLIHLPIHASWLNQIEIYFAILQRKVLTPADCDSLDQLQDLILRFQQQYEETARPFKWRFTKADLADLLERLSAYNYYPPMQAAA